MNIPKNTVNLVYSALINLSWILIRYLIDDTAPFANCEIIQMQMHNSFKFKAYRKKFHKEDYRRGGEVPSIVSPDLC